MGTRYGPFFDGTNVMLVPASGGRIVTDGALFDQLFLKTNNGYALSGLHIKTYALTTTDATSTTIVSIPIPSNYAIVVLALIVGKKTSAADTSAYTLVGAGSNTAGTSAEIGSDTLVAMETTGSTTALFSVDNTDDVALIKVTGVVAETYSWSATVLYALVSTSA